MIGDVLRYPLRWMPTEAVVPILLGPNKGLRWTVGAGTHGCWIGWYDRYVQGRLTYALRPGDTAYDIGAHTGFFTLMMARIVGPTGHIYAFEPFPENIAVLRRHLALNHLQNVTVIEAAVSDVAGTAMFQTGPNTSIGRLHPDGQVRVPTVALDDLDLPLPRLIKMDIEGGEHLALAGMLRTLREARPFLVIEPH